MSDILSRYVFRQLLVGMVLVTAALCGVLWLTQSLRLVELIVNRGASIGTFLTLTLLLLPNFLTIILPISLFAVVLFTYNKLTSDRELVVMRASGLGQWGLAKPALALAVGATLLGYVLNLWLIPMSVVAFKEMQWSVRNDLSALVLQEGVFNPVSYGLTVYVRARSQDGELLDILVHDTRQRDKDVTIMANRGALVRGPTSARVVMVEGNRQEKSNETGRVSVLYFDSYAIDFGSGEPTGARDRDARERPIGELLTISLAEAGGRKNLLRFRAEGHQRLASPLYHLTFAVIGLAALLAGSFNRRGNMLSIMGAIGAVIAVQAVGLGAQNLSAGNEAFWPLIYVTPLLPAVVVLYYLLYPPRKRPKPPAVSSPSAAG